MKKDLVRESDWIDLRAFKKLEDLEAKMGKENLVKKLVDLYLKDSGKKVSKINKAFKEKDFRTLQIESHSLASTSLSLGGVVVGENCRQIEEFAEHKGKDQKEKEVQRIINNLDIYNQFFQRELLKQVH